MFPRKLTIERSKQAPHMQNADEAVLKDLWRWTMLATSYMRPSDVPYPTRLVAVAQIEIEIVNDLPWDQRKIYDA